MTLTRNAPGEVCNLGHCELSLILEPRYSFASGQVLFVPAGFPVLGDTPVVGDFDGDGKADPGILRESQGVWILPLSSSNYASFIFARGVSLAILLFRIAPGVIRALDFPS